MLTRSLWVANDAGAAGSRHTLAESCFDGRLKACLAYLATQLRLTSKCILTQIQTQDFSQNTLRNRLTRCWSHFG